MLINLALAAVMTLGGHAAPHQVIGQVGTRPLPSCRIVRCYIEPVSSHRHGPKCTTLRCYITLAPKGAELR